MLSEEDIKNLIKAQEEVFVTKGDLRIFKGEIVDMFVTKEEFKEGKKEITDLKEAVQTLTVSIDKLVKSVEDLKIEYSAITTMVNRHETWLKQIAEKVGMKLEY